MIIMILQNLKKNLLTKIGMCPEHDYRHIDYYMIMT